MHIRRSVSSSAHAKAAEQHFQNVRLIAGSNCEPIDFIDLPANAWLRLSGSGISVLVRSASSLGAYREVPVASSTKPVCCRGRFSRMTVTRCGGPALVIR